MLEELELEKGMVGPDYTIKPISFGLSNYLQDYYSVQQSFKMAVVQAYYKNILVWF